ncbi:MAG: HD-GYP domain-containing protein [bacterium]
MTATPDIDRAKILIVDDFKDNVSLLERMLHRAGYFDIRSTTDSRNTASLYHDFKPDLLLLDLDMPYLDGFQVMEQLQEIEKDSYLPILVLTADSSQTSRLKALKSGAKDFLSKPLDKVEVLTRIRNMLEVRLLHNQLRDQNKILEDKVRERTKELHRTRLEVIRRLGRAAEYRDSDTGLHIIRMSLFAERLARALGLSARECELLLNASPMHDIGKIGIPDIILLKTGKLDPEEWQIMKQHTQIGAEILSGSDTSLMQMARHIALTHHERWDGSGYPNALKCEEIHLHGRIAALCDVFDALTSSRPYKRAWTVDEAIAKIADESGKHFDPFLVENFLSILPQIIEIKEHYNSNSARE